MSKLSRRIQDLGVEPPLSMASPQPLMDCLLELIDVARKLENDKINPGIKASGLGYVEG